MNDPQAVPSTAPPSALPQFSASQASSLIRSALAISAEIMTGSFGKLVDEVRDGLVGRRDFEVGSPVVQRMLASRSQELRNAFVARLRELQDQALERLLATSTARTVANTEFDASLLELVNDNDDRRETIAASAARRMRGLVEEPLRDVELIISFLSGRTNVPHADCPVGPDPFVGALLKAAIDVELNPEAWVFFLTAFEPEFGKELGHILQSLVDHFRTHGIDARAVRRDRNARRPRPAPRPAAALGATGPAMAGGWGGGAGSTGGAGSAGGDPVVHGVGGSLTSGASPAEATMILKELLGRLQGNAGGTALAPLAGSDSPIPPKLMDSLGELQTLGLQGIHGAVFAGTPAGSINAWREHLVSQSTRTVDKLTIEIVGMMFDHVLRDSQIPSEIKAILSRLQFPMLKAALIDAAFFASSAHPARRLIDRMAAASIGWEPYGDENERFRSEVDRLVLEVMMKFERDVSIFERVLNEFEAFLGELGPRETDPIARAKQALEEAEKREVLVINTTIQMRRAFEKVQLEGWMRDFLLGPWVQVLALASTRDDQTKGYSKSFREVIHELVWSIQPKASADERRRLVELIPLLTRVVRDGLALIRMPQRDQDEFLQKLMAAHAFAVKPTDQATYIKSSLQSSEIRAKIEGLQLTGSFPLTSVPGGVKVPAGAMLRAAADHEVELTVPAALTDVGTIDKSEDARPENDLSQWPRGSWFEIWNGEAFIKARLRWISPLRTMFMFSGGPQNKAQVMSPDLIHSYLNQDLLRPLGGAPLTERAANAVVADFASAPDRAEELANRLTVA
jgi:hypothetical protein